MASHLTSPVRFVSAALAVVLAAALFAPVCRMLSCEGGLACGHPAPERSRFTSACGGEAPKQSGGSSCGGAVMRYEEPATPSAAREAADTQTAAVALSDPALADPGVGAVQALLAESEAPPAPPPDPLFGRLVI